MKKSYQKINHEFHFIISNEMYDKLHNLFIPSIKGKQNSINEKVLFIFNHTKSYIDYNHFYGREERSKYIRISKNLKEQKHVHLFMPEKLYKKLKLIYVNLNFYSLAQVIRRIIEKFLNYYEPNKFVKSLMELKKLADRLMSKINNEIDRTKIIQHMSEKIEIKQTYNSNYSVIWTEVLKN